MELQCISDIISDIKINVLCHRVHCAGGQQAHVSGHGGKVAPGDAVSDSVGRELRYELALQF